MVRALVALPVVLCLAWMARSLYRLGPGKEAARRRIAGAYRIFDPPDRR